MAISELVAQAIKNTFGISKAIPKNSSRIDTKNGLRDCEKIPCVISLPLLFLFRPKRIDFPIACKDKYKAITERIHKQIPKTDNKGGRVAFLLKKAGRIDTVTCILFNIISEINIPKKLTRKVPVITLLNCAEIGLAFTRVFRY